MIFKFIKMKICSISIWRWFILILFFSSAIWAFAVSMSNGSNIYEYVVNIIIDPIVICYLLLFVILIIAADVYNGTINSFDDYVLVEFGNRKKWLTANLCYIIFLSFILVLLCFLIIFLIILFHNQGKDLFVNQWSFTNELFYKGISPLTSIVISFFLWFCRCAFICLLIFFINFKSKFNPLGFVGAIIVTIVDFFFYDLFNILKPLNILPIERNRQKSDTLYSTTPNMRK